MKQQIRKALREIYWAYHGKGLKNPRLPTSPKSILYVCKGNICRSPFAERLTKKLVEKTASDTITIRSAGIDATISNPPPKEAMDAAITFGISLDDHRAQKLTQELISRSGMVVVMEVGHLHQFEEAYPEYKGKCFLLSMFSHDQRRWGKYYSHCNIADPYGKNTEQFIICYENIEICIKNLLQKIRLN